MTLHDELVRLDVEPGSSQLNGAVEEFVRFAHATVMFLDNVYAMRVRLRLLPGDSWVICKQVASMALNFAVGVGNEFRMRIRAQFQVCASTVRVLDFLQPSYHRH